MYRVTPIFLGLCDLNKKGNPFAVTRVLYANESEKFWWAWETEQIIRAGKDILNRVKNRVQQEHFDMLKEQHDRAIASAEKIKKTEIKKIQNKELICLYKEHLENSKEALAVTGLDIDAIDMYPVEYFKEKLKKALPNISVIEFNDIYSKISIPAHMSYVKEEEVALLKLIVKYKKWDNIKNKLQPIKDKFWWISLGWESMKTNTEKDFKNAIIRYMKDIKNPEQYLREIENSVEKIKRDRNSLLSKYNLNGEIIKLIELFDNYALFHDLRKEMQVRTSYSFHLLMLETARRLNLDPEDLEWLWPDEFCKILRGKPINKTEVEKRKKAIVVFVDNEKIFSWSGNKAIQKRKQEFEQEIKTSDEIKGVGVSLGKVTARVKVCKGVKEALQKIKQGDILVTGMTMPEYIPAMKKSAAIITNEGGITCHAAIISREFGIPCIVATKIATKILKDGDLVEVNANHGIVKIIKKNNGE